MAITSIASVERFAFGRSMILKSMSTRRSGRFVCVDRQREFVLRERRSKRSSDDVLRWIVWISFFCSRQHDDGRRSILHDDVPKVFHWSFQRSLTRDVFFLSNEPISPRNEHIELLTKTPRGNVRVTIARGVFVFDLRSTILLSLSFQFLQFINTRRSTSLFVNEHRKRFRSKEKRDRREERRT